MTQNQTVDQQQQILEGIANQAQDTSGNIYQSFMGSLANAAALANLPKWRETLESEYDRFVAESQDFEKQFKDSLQTQLPAEALLAGRGAVTTGIERSVEAATKHKESLITLIEKLRGEDGDE